MTPDRVPKNPPVDAEIAFAFDGRNYPQLAHQFGISEHQVRAAVERYFSSVTGERIGGFSNLYKQPFEIVKLSRLEVLRNATAWAVLRLLFPRALARAKSAALSLIQEEQPNPASPSGHRPGQLENVLIDFHPARPTAARPATSTALGYVTFSEKKPAQRRP